MASLLPPFPLTNKPDKLEGLKRVVGEMNKKDVSKSLEHTNRLQENEDGKYHGKMSREEEEGNDGTRH